VEDNEVERGWGLQDQSINGFRCKMSYTFSRYFATERKMKASDIQQESTWSTCTNLCSLAAQSMEPIFLQASFPGNVLVNRIACDVVRYRTVERSIKEGDRVGVRKRFEACFDNR
jgi:hypothetical protein